MPSPRPLRLVPVLALLALAACGNGDAAENPPAAGSAAATAGEPDRVGDGSDDRIEVTIEGTPFAGTHREVGELSCMMYGGLWQAVHEDLDAPGLSALLVQLKEIPATGGSTDLVTLSMTFGRMDEMSGTAGIVDVVGSEFGGDARATVAREGEGAVLRVEGTAQQGGRVTAVLHCADVELMR